MKPVETDCFKIRLPDTQQIGSAQQGADITGPDGQIQTAQEMTAQGRQIIVPGGGGGRGRGGPAETVEGRTAPARPPQGAARQAAPGRHPPHRHPVRQGQRHGMPPRLIQGTGLQSWKCGR